MQYNKDKFKYYYSNYKDIKDRIEETKNIINGLLQDDKLTKTISFYNNLSSSDKKIFNDINCNIDFVRYKINQRKIDELEKGLNSLYVDFIKSEAFPFPIAEFHFFVRKNNYLTDAISGKDSSGLSEKNNRFLSDSIVNVFHYNPNDYNEDDIPLIKVLYLRNKSLYKNYVTLLDVIKSNIKETKDLDEKRENNSLYRTYRYKETWKIKHFKNKLLTQEQRVLNSDSKYKELLLFSIRSAFYELELLSGKRVIDLLNHLESMDVVNKHQERKKEYEIEALVKAYYNLTDINFKGNSNYFPNNDYIYAKFETADKKVNDKMLKMMKR